MGSRLGPGKSSETHSQGSPSDPGSRQGPAASTRSQTQKTNTPQFKVGDRVVSYNKQQVPIHGTVKWTGGQALTEGGKMNVVGIETVSTVTRSIQRIFEWACTRTVPAMKQEHLGQLLRQSMLTLSSALASKHTDHLNQSICLLGTKLWTD